MSEESNRLRDVTAEQLIASLKGEDRDAEISRLRAENERLKVEVLDWMTAENARLQSELSHLRTENENLRQANLKLLNIENADRKELARRMMEATLQEFGDDYAIETTDTHAWFDAWWQKEQK